MQRELDCPSLVRRAGTLRLSSKIISDSMRSGSFRSLSRGRGIEFSGVREYLRGDDVRAIDWNVTARMGRTFVKQFEEDRDLILFVIVDTSLSMQTGSGPKSRLYSACETAALMSFAAAYAGGPVGGVLFNQDITFSSEPRNGRDSVMLLLSRFDEALDAAVSGGNTTAPGSALDKALKGAALLLKKRSLVIVISDFRTTGYERSLGMLSRRHDVIAVRITDTSDSDLPEIGTLPFIDMESSYSVRLPTSSMAFRRAWKEAESRRVERWQTECGRRNVKTLCISTLDDPAQNLQRFFAGREG